VSPALIVATHLPSSTYSLYLPIYILFVVGYVYYLHPEKALTSTTTDVRYIKALMAKLLGGGPVVFGRGDEEVLALSGFYDDDWPATNFLSLLIYKWKRGQLELPPIAAAPVVNERAFMHGGGWEIYFDFLELKSAEAREITQFYHKARPRVVAVFLGGKEFEVAATTEVAASALAVKKITPNPHTPEGAATLKYSHALVIRVPPTPRDFHIYLRHVAGLLKQAVALPPMTKPTVKVAAKEIYLLHGGRRVDDGVLLDNEVHHFI